MAMINMPLYVRKSLLSALWLVPGFLLPRVMERNFGVKPEVTLFYFVLGMLVGIPLQSVRFSHIPLKDFTPTNSLIVPFFVVFFVGAIAGVAANIYAYQATIIAPNPGIATSILSLTNMLIFFSAIVLAALWPRWFEAAPFAWHHLAGIFLVLAGIFLLSVKKIDIGIFVK